MKATAAIIALVCASLLAAGAREEAVPVPLPFVMADQHGMRWDIQANGSIGDGGNDQYDGGGHLYVDGNFQWQGRGQAMLNRERNELILGPATVKGLNITRRIAVDAQAGYCRWAEVLENPGNDPVRTSLRVYYNMGAGVGASQPFREEKNQKRQIGVLFADSRQCWFAVLGAGRGSKLLPNLQPQPNSDTFNISYDVEVPPKKTAILVHVHAFRRSSNDGERFLSETKEKDILATLPKELRKLVVNFKAGESFAGDLEVLRGDVMDVVELRGGDQLRGNLLLTAYRLDTFYGRVEVPAGKVQGVISVGAFRPRQLVVTGDGEVIGGQLAEQAVTIRLSSGQDMAVPLSRITRIGHRRRGDEPEEIIPRYPMLHLRGGDRILVDPPAGPVQVTTRYGALALPPQSIASIALASEESPVHEITLCDGSRFAGLAMATQFEFQLAGGYAKERAKFPLTALSRIQFAAPPEQLAGGEMKLVNGDLLCGMLDGQCTLETAFDQIAIACPEIQRLSHIKGSPSDVRLTLWDGSVLLGQLKEGQVSCRLASGPAVTVAVPLIDEYVQPRPRPSEAIRKTIAALVAELGAEEWKRRDLAQQKLTSMGPIVIPQLQEMRAAQNPEAQQRIDLVLKAVDKP